MLTNEEQALCQDVLAVFVQAEKDLHEAMLLAQGGCALHQLAFGLASYTEACNVIIDGVVYARLMLRGSVPYDVEQLEYALYGVELGILSFITSIEMADSNILRKLYHDALGADVQLALG